jgi:ribokinase
MIDVAVVGSLHLDIMVMAPRLPGRDETLIGSAWNTKCGGKGGNQAVAAARFGARVAFGGRTGADEFGDRLRGNLVAAGVDTACIETDPEQGSGMSVAINEDGGEYGAVVVSGANLGIGVQSIAGKWKALWQCKVLLLQNEIPEAVNIAAATEARKAGAQIVFNAAPARVTSSRLLDLVDVMIVNRVEASMLAGTDDMAKAIAALHTGSLDVVLTRGAEGLSVKTRYGQFTELPALAVRMISSHGAGDCFCGALAARLAAGDPLLKACAYARTAAGLFVALAEGSQSSLTPAMVASHALQP